MNYMYLGCRTAGPVPTPCSNTCFYATVCMCMQWCFTCLSYNSCMTLSLALVLIDRLNLYRIRVIAPTLQNVRRNLIVNKQLSIATLFWHQKNQQKPWVMKHESVLQMSMKKQLLVSYPDPITSQQRMDYITATLVQGVWENALQKTVPKGILIIFKANRTHNELHQRQEPRGYLDTW